MLQKYNYRPKYQYTLPNILDSVHLPFAKNVGSVDGFGDMLNGWDKSLTCLVYCHADAPSMSGAQLMEDAGLKNVYRLEGNYSAWVDAGYDVE